MLASDGDCLMFCRVASGIRRKDANASERPMNAYQRTGVIVLTGYDTVSRLFENAGLFAPVAFVLTFGYGFTAIQAIRCDMHALFVAIDYD